MKLNLGCGRNVLTDWVNVDKSITTIAGNTLVADIEQERLPFEKESCDEFLLSHVIEHIKNPLFVFEEMYRLAKPNAKCIVKCPYGSSDDADEDPTHVRRMFIGSFGYFGQPNYWRSDYGYRGDWHCYKVTLIVPQGLLPKPFDNKKFFEMLQTKRNIVVEMIAELRAIKPMREQNKELITVPAIEISPGI